MEIRTLRDSDLPALERLLAPTDARRAGRASEGASLFTGAENLPALPLCDRLGFREDADWQLGFLA